MKSKFPLLYIVSTFLQGALRQLSIPFNGDFGLASGHLERISVWVLQFATIFVLIFSIDWLEMVLFSKVE
jgi:hypothetical protein